MSKSKKKPSFLVPLGQRIVYLLFRLIEGFLSLLPVSVVFSLGSFFGTIAYYLLVPYRKVVLRNLRIAYDQEPEVARRRLARKHFATLGGNILSSIKIMTMSEDALRSCVKIDNAVLKQSVAEGRGVILAICHMGNWEFLTQARQVVRREKRSAMYQALKNPFLNAHLLQRRERMGAKLFEKKDGFFGPLAHLREGGSIGILVDQHAGDLGVWTPFFGRLASTSNLAPLLAQRTDSAIFPLAVYTEGKGQWRVVVESPLDPRHNKMSIDEMAAELNVRIEAMIAKSPQDWFWVHNRWKIPKPEFLLNYYKRGVVYPRGYREESLKKFRIIVRSPNWLGDACMAVPAVKAMTNGRPDAELTVLCSENLGPLWKSVAGVHSVICFKKKESPWSVSRRIRKVGVPFDVAVLLPNSLRSALEMTFTGIPRVLGYKGHSRKAFLNQIIKVPQSRRPKAPTHHVNHYLRLARQVGADIKQPGLLEFGDDLPARSEDGILRIGLCAGAEYGSAKRWPLSRFAKVADEISAKYECEWVIFGTPAEAELGKKLEERISGRLRNLIGKTTMAQLMSEIQGCKAMLTNDTGTMHLAAHLGIPTISIFGSTEPELTGPLGEGHKVFRKHVDCSPCFLRECPFDFRCMNAVEPEEVAEAVSELVSK